MVFRGMAPLYREIIMRWIVSALLVMSIALTAQAAKKANTAKKPDPAATTQAAAQQVADARTALASAQKDLNAAQKELDVVSDKLKQKFEASDEWTQAQAKLKDAREARDKSVAPVTDALHKTPAYQAAISEKEKAASEIARLRQNGASAAEMTAAATKVTAATAAVNKLEADAINNDPAAKAASQEFADAGANCGKLRQKFLESIKTTPEFTSAKEALDSARTKRDQADAALGAAIKQQQEADTNAEQQAEKQEEQRREHPTRRRYRISS